MATYLPQSESEEVAPFRDWNDVYAELQTTFKQGDHVTIVGPAGAGKTHLSLAIAEIRTYVLFLACKPRDPLISELKARGYYEIREGKVEIPYADGKPLHRRVVYWPKFSEKATKNDQERERKLQSEAMRKAFGYVRRNGSWALIIDEGTWVCRDLNLQRLTDSMWFQGRTLGVSVILSTQRPAWVGQYAFSQAEHIFLFQTGHREDLKSMGDIAGVDTMAVREITAQLDSGAHELLYINVRNREMWRTVAPAR